ncbi:hypothetical protein WAJ13_23600, partial [Acinetobacter baumannii]
TTVSSTPAVVSLMEIIDKSKPIGAAVSLDKTLPVIRSVLLMVATTSLDDNIKLPNKFRDNKLLKALEVEEFGARINL